MAFNVTKFCRLAGHYSDVSAKYRTSFLFVFGLIGVLIVAGNIAALIITVKQKLLFKKKYSFLVSLALTDFLYGVTFIPLFIIELSDGEFGKSCNIRSWRVLTFTYFFSTRLLSIFFFSVQTYIKTCRVLTKLEHHFDQWTNAMNVGVVWLLTPLFILTVGTSDIQADKVLGALTLCYLLASMICIIVSCIMIIIAIKRARKRVNNAVYNGALAFIRVILICFLTTNIPLSVLGIVLVVFAHHPFEEAREYLEHQIYIACLAVASVDAIANPVVYFHKLREFNQELTSMCRTLCCKKKTQCELVIRVDDTGITNDAFQKAGTA